MATGSMCLTAKRCIGALDRIDVLLITGIQEN